MYGGAAEFERELPFGLVVDAVDEYLETMDPHAFQRLAGEDLTELAGVFPSLRSLDPGSDQPSTAAERFRAHRAVCGLLEHLAARQPLVLALDDLHWADGASLELISHLLRRPPRAAVMVAATFRRGQIDRALTSTIERGMREADGRVHLGPLPRDQAHALVDETPSANYQDLYETSGGNPLYLLELARLAAGGEPRLSREGDAGVPATVAAATAGELDALSARGRGLAEAAAVAGDPFELDLAAASADMAEPNALDALDELVARDLVRSTRVPRRFRFRHPLVRRAVYESCSPGARIAAHRRTAHALAARGATPTARAHHVEHSAQHGDMAAVAILQEAGEAAAKRAPASAARWSMAALGLLPDNAPRSQRMNLLMALAGAQAATGRFEDSRTALLDCVDLTSDDEGTLRVQLIGACAGVEQLLGHHEEAHARLTATLSGLSDASSPQAVELMLHLAAGDFYRMDYEGMHGWGERALGVARALGEPLTAASLAVLAVAAAFLGPVSEAEAYRSQAAALVDALPDDELAARLDAVTNLTAADLYLHRYADAAAHADRGLELARGTGQGEVAPFLIPVLVTVLHTTGRIAEAADLVDEAVDAARLSGNEETLGWNLLSRGYVAVAAGDLELALSAAQESVDVTRELDDRLVSTYARWALASALLEKGEAAARDRGSRDGRRGQGPAAHTRALAGPVLRALDQVLARVRPTPGGGGDRDSCRRHGGTGGTHGRRRDGQPGLRRRRVRERRSGDRRRPGPRRGCRVRRERRPRRCSASPNARGASAGGRRRAGSGHRGVGAGRRRARSLRSASLPRRGRARAAQARPALRAGARGPRVRTARDSRHSASASSKSRGWSSTATRIRRSPARSSSARRRSRPTCATSSASSTCRPAPTSPGRSSARVA